MSWKATSATKSLGHDANGKRLSAREKLVLFVLADSVDPHTGLAWPSQRLLAEQSLSSIRTVRRILERLDDRGLVEIIGPGGRGGHRYRLTYVPTEDEEKPVRMSAFSGKGKRTSHMEKRPNSEGKADTAMSAQPKEPYIAEIEPAQTRRGTLSTEVEQKRRIEARDRREKLEAAERVRQGATSAEVQTGLGPDAGFRCRQCGQVFERHAQVCDHADKCQRGKAGRKDEPAETPSMRVGT